MQHNIFLMEANEILLKCDTFVYAILNNKPNVIVYISSNVCNKQWKIFQYIKVSLHHIQFLYFLKRSNEDIFLQCLSQLLWHLCLKFSPCLIFICIHLTKKFTIAGISKMLVQVKVIRKSIKLIDLSHEYNFYKKVILVHKRSMSILPKLLSAFVKTLNLIFLDLHDVIVCINTFK